MKTERRYLHGELRIKADTSGKQKISGYAAKFNSMSEDLGGFIEEIDPHAFDACLAANPDVRGLWNHDPNYVLGRTRANTLQLTVDTVGLHYEIDPPNTQVAKDLMVSMQRGDVTQSSFGFICIEDTWRQGANGNLIRTVLKADLIDVSPVTFPAYVAATSEIASGRSLFPDGDDEIRAKVAEIRSAYSARSTTAKTKEVDGVELPASCFAYVGDPTETDTWKLPVHFPGDEEKTKSHIRNALARFDQTEGIPEDKKAETYARIVGAAKAHGISVSKESLHEDTGNRSLEDALRIKLWTASRQRNL